MTLSGPCVTTTPVKIWISSSEDSGRRGAFEGAIAASTVQRAIENYSHQLCDARSQHGTSAAGLARNYYELVTDFYEYGWGQSFHFAPRRRGESVRRSLQRCEQQLGCKLGLQAGMRALDVGCGVAGPMRTIARSTGARIVGLSNSPYHVRRGRRHVEREGLGALCELVEGDFNAMSFADATFDVAFSLEACCHAADRRQPFAEVLRVLKPGALFAGQDWCMTPRYHSSDSEHVRIKVDIEQGCGIARLVPSSELVRALNDVGFEVLEAGDAAEQPDAVIPWYRCLASGISLRGFRNSRMGGFLTHQLVRLLEAVGVSARGTVQVHDVLRGAQRALVEGGQTGIFTPIYAWVARKPGPWPDGGRDLRVRRSLP